MIEKVGQKKHQGRYMFLFGEHELKEECSIFEDAYENIGKLSETK